MNVGASEEGENEEERIGCSAVCLPFKGKIGGTVRLSSLLSSLFSLNLFEGEKIFGKLNF